MADADYPYIHELFVDEGILGKASRRHIMPTEDDQVRRLAGALRNDVRLKELCITLSFAPSLWAAQELGDAFRTNTTLAQLVIITYEPWPILTTLLEGVAVSTSISKLALWNHFDAAALIECLHTSTSIETLAIEFSDTENHEGGTSLINAFSDGSLPRIKRLELGNCTMDVPAQVAKMVEVNDTLQVLDLNSHDNAHLTYVGDDGAKMIAKALLKNKTITTVKLVGCGIGREGAVAVADWIKRSNTIREIDIGGNPDISDTGKQALVDALSINLSVTDLYTRHIQLAPSLRKQFKRSRAINRFRKKYLEQDHSTISAALYPYVFASVSEKPSALFLFLQEQSSMFIPHLPDPSGLSSSRKRKMEG
jgi:hypothetical protein